jgi:biopolymer transport protein ExbB
MNPRSLMARLPAALLFLTALAAPVLAQDGAAPAATSQVKKLTVGNLIVDSGFIGWIIVVLSVVALALIIEAFVSLKREKLAPPELIDEIQALFDEGQFQEAMQLCENEPTFLTRICGAGIAKIGHPFEVIQTALQEMGDEESVRLNQKLGWLAVVAAVAPMLGLLGTVQGMILAFHQIAASGGQATPADLANSISIALLTTLFGLMVAIPVISVMAYLRNRLIRSIIEVGAIVEDLFERFRPAASS